MKDIKVKIGDKVRFSLMKVNDAGIPEEITWDAIIDGFSESKDYGKMVIIKEGFQFPFDWIQTVLTSR